MRTQQYSFNVYYQLCSIQVALIQIVMKSNTRVEYILDKVWNYYSSTWNRKPKETSLATTIAQHNWTAAVPRNSSAIAAPIEEQCQCRVTHWSERVHIASLVTGVENDYQYSDANYDKHDDYRGTLRNDCFILGFAWRLYREPKWLSGDDRVPLWRERRRHRAAEWLEHQQRNWFLHTANAKQHRLDSRWENKHAISGPRSRRIWILATEDTFGWCIFCSFGHYSRLTAC